MQMLWIYQAHALYIRNLLFLHIYIIHPVYIPPLGPELLSDTLSLAKDDDRRTSSTWPEQLLVTW